MDINNSIHHAVKNPTFKEKNLLEMRLAVLATQKVEIKKIQFKDDYAQKDNGKSGKSTI